MKENKERLDLETPYLNLLPNMDEGMHLGYRAEAGVLCDGNQRPHEWLENFARFIQAPGSDVGYSIPDVLANEHQLRRLFRAPRETAMRRQEILDYRGVLTLLLLWDLLCEDGSCAALELETFDFESASGFIRSVGGALSPRRATEGLRVFTLRRSRSEDPEAVPLCLLSRETIVTPAANMSDLSLLLPPSVRWYDREQKRFVDPCGLLDERMISVLIPRLRLLAALNENPQAESPLYSPEARLHSLLDRMARDVLAGREAWRARLEAGDAAAEEELRVRVATVYGLGERETGLALTTQRLPAQLKGWEQNPLLRCFVREDRPLPEIPEGEEILLYLLNGTPFARRSDAYLLEPARTAGEEETLRRAGEEVSLLDRNDENWRQETAKRLTELAEEWKGRAGVSQTVPHLLEKWSRVYASSPRGGDGRLTLRYPEDTSVESLSSLLRSVLGETADSWIREPFSHCLLLAEGCERSPFSAPGLQARGTDRPAWFVPPLSQALAEWLTATGEKDDPYAPRLVPESLDCEILPDGTRARASFAVECRLSSAEGLRRERVSFVRTYELRALPEEGAAVALDGAALPMVTVWPNVRLREGQWKRYYVHTRRPEALDVWALARNGWKQGRLKSVQEPQKERRAWQTVCVDRFPAFVCLKRGTLSMGALCNDLPLTPLRREADAVIAVDFGSHATTVMLRQGDKVQPASLPRSLHGALMKPDAEEERWLEDEFLPPDALTAGQPGESGFYSVMEMFGDDPEEWREPFLDGHIYYPRGLSALLAKSGQSLYYDLKWSEEEWVLRCLRLFLKQTMLQAALSARLWGSPSLSWRISMPGALPSYRKEAYLDMARGLAREVSAETGMPLSGGVPPVLYALESQADGWYFLSHNEVNASQGYLNLDVGGSTADLSLWLGGKPRPVAECSLLLGCRQMLFVPFSAGRADAFEKDFSQGGEEMARAARELARRMRLENATTRDRQKTMLLMDDFFASYAGEIREAVAAARARGQISYTECLLLFHFGFLFTLCGLLLDRAWKDEELRPLTPSTLAVCLAGNGGQLMKIFSREQTGGLCRMAMQALSENHPVEALLPVQSAAPKQEAALGLLYEGGDLHSALHNAERWNGSLPPGEGENENVLTAYLLRFANAFPQAARRLLGDACVADPVRGEARLTPSVRMELETIWANERAKTPEDDFATLVRCFQAVKLRGTD